MNFRQVNADGLKWRIAEAGSGPAIFLVHGTGSSIHSWRDIMPLLAETHRVVAVDLPGHGETATRTSSDFTLPRMGRGLLALLQAIDIVPEKVVGHSAGAAILAWMCARGLKPSIYVSFNGAFYPFAGAMASFFSPVAKLLAINPLMTRLMSASASVASVERMLRDTGSNLTPEGVEAYYDLFKKPDQVAGALSMMASWDLKGMEADLSRIAADCVFVAGQNDGAVAPDTADRAAAVCRKAKVLHIDGFGHLLHEEDPALAAAIILGKRS